LHHSPVNRAAEFLRRRAATGSGALVGAAGGVPGVAFGALVGALVDQVRSPRLPALARFLADPDRVRGAFDGPRVATIALFAATAAIEATQLDGVHAEAERRWPCSEEKALRRLRRTVHTVLHFRGMIRADRIIAYLASTMSPEERIEVATAMLRVAAGSESGIGNGERRFVAQVARAWAVSSETMAAAERSVGGMDRGALRILGLAGSASREEIRAVYRELARHFHPDTASLLDESQRTEITGAFGHVREAYERLVEQLDERDRTWAT